MKHAGPAVLDTIEPLLAQLRALPGLKEKSRGSFYRKSRGFLHFHEDPKGLFADIRLTDDGDFERLDVTSDAAKVELLALARARASA
jgi:hypothetical protein